MKKSCCFDGGRHVGRKRFEYVPGFRRAVGPLSGGGCGHSRMDMPAIRSWSHVFMNERRRQLQEVEPCRGHVLLAAMEQDYDVTVITQNVDNLHERAGSTKVVHLHGELTKVTSSLEPDNPKYIRELRPEEWEVKNRRPCGRRQPVAAFHRLVRRACPDDRGCHRHHFYGGCFCRYRHFPECLPGGRAAELRPVPCSHLCDRSQARGRYPWRGTCASFDERSFRRGGRAYGLFGKIMKGQKEEARLSLLQEFWENMFHLSGCSVSLLYIASYELKDDFTIFSPVSRRAL